MPVCLFMNGNCKKKKKQIRKHDIISKFTITNHHCCDNILTLFNWYIVLYELCSCNFHSVLQVSNGLSDLGIGGYRTSLFAMLISMWINVEGKVIYCLSFQIKKSHLYVQMGDNCGAIQCPLFKINSAFWNDLQQNWLKITKCVFHSNSIVLFSCILV